MRWAVVLIALLPVVALAGCSKDEPEMTERAAAQLQPRVAEIRQLAGERKADQVAAKLAELRTIVEDLRADGDLSADRARDVLAAADGVQSRLRLITTTTTPPPRHDEGRDEDDDEKEKEGRDDRKEKEKDD